VPPDGAANRPAPGTAAEAAALDRAEAAVADVCTRLDLLGRRGDARLAGVLAAACHAADRAGLAARLVAPLGMPLARRVADLVGLHPVLHRPFPDARRRAGLLRLADAADLGVLHALAAAVLAGRDDPTATAARDQVGWSELHAEDAGLLGEAPLEPLRAGLRSALAGLDRDAADRCWAEARSAHAQGRIGTDGVARKLLRRLGGLGLAPAGRAGPAVGGWDRHHRGRGCAGHRCGR